jgi:hypothetical protein
LSAEVGRYRSVSVGAADLRDSSAVVALPLLMSAGLAVPMAVPLSGLPIGAAAVEPRTSPT